MEARTTLITGGAKRLGKAMAEHFAARGFNVILHYNNSIDEANALAERLRQDYKIEVQLWHADLTSLAPETLTNLPKFDLLINNAAMFLNDSLLDCSLESLQNHCTVNFFAPILLMQHLAKQNLRQADVINIVDSYTYKYGDDFFSYFNSKRALTEATKHAAVLLAPRVRVNAIALGHVLPGVRQSREHFSKAQSQALLSKSPATIEQLLQAIDFILQLNCLTGQILMLDGGAHLAHNTSD